jgi:predicted transposase YbfD/YdcC
VASSHQCQLSWRGLSNILSDEHFEEAIIYVPSVGRQSSTFRNVARSKWGADVFVHPRMIGDTIAQATRGLRNGVLMDGMDVHRHLERWPSVGRIWISKLD